MTAPTTVRRTVINLCAQFYVNVMAKITQQPPITPSSRPLKQPIKVAPSEKTNQEWQDLKADKPFVERRKNRDRRSQRADRGPYDSRAGKDRRKNSPPDGKIEIDV